MQYLSTFSLAEREKLRYTSSQMERSDVSSAITGAELRRFRAEHLLPLRVVATAAGVSVETVRRFERGDSYKSRGPQMLTTERIRRAMEVIAARSGDHSTQ